MCVLTILRFRKEVITYYSVLPWNSPEKHEETYENWIVDNQGAIRPCHSSSEESVYRRAKLDGLGSITGTDNRFSHLHSVQDRLCGPLSLLSNGYRGLFRRG
jgi:hypothetical protein